MYKLRKHCGNVLFAIGSNPFNRGRHTRVIIEGFKRPMKGMIVKLRHRLLSSTYSWCRIVVGDIFSLPLPRFGFCSNKIITFLSSFFSGHFFSAFNHYPCLVYDGSNVFILKRKFLKD
uniref:ORF122 n=1 Tax=Malaco herpesvirus 1 TaxID=3031797 RepID=A0AA48SF32_9VIRU|nr:TPA_asm: ORF122 [Malaco herpesvirus 1]